MLLFLKSLVWKSQFDFLTAIVTAPKPTDAEGKWGCWDSHTKQGVQTVPDTTPREQLQVTVWADAAGRQEGQELQLVQELWPGLS